MKRAGVALALLGALGMIISTSAVKAAASLTGTYTHHTLPAAADGSYPARDYWLYVPRALSSPRSVVTFLHGCGQSGDDAARGVGWNELADKKGFVVVYPEQHFPAAEDGDVDGSAARCWNNGQAALPRGQGELETVAQITRTVLAESNGSTGRSYLVGISSGAMMANVMVATYPELYTAFSSIAGCSYMCSDPTGDLAYTRMAERARAMPAFVVTGSADYLANPVMGELTVTQWLGTNDLIDDGEHNQSVSLAPASTEQRNIDALTRPDPSTGDACAHDFPRNPCALGAAGIAPYPVTLRTYNDAAGKTIVEAWLIHGLSHNYSGGSFAGTYTDPFGPDITTAIWDFFVAHAVAAAPQVAGARVDAAPGGLPATGRGSRGLGVASGMLALALTLRRVNRLRVDTAD